jgi:hypothetical protein
MSEIIAFHPRVSPLVNLYEIVDEKGEAIWGGNDTHEAIRYLRSSPVNCRVLVSGWDSDEEDAHLGRPVHWISPRLSLLRWRWAV